jgi:serine/threonine protein phosphatase 1
MKNTLIIGDIHGCFTELQALLDKAGLGEADAVIGIGDVVDRGPETPQVVNYFQKTRNTMAIMGNHERKHVRAARHEVKLSLSQQISQAQFGATYQEALDWMSGLPLYIELEHAIVVHGYFEPGIALEHQLPSVLCGTMGGERILRQRYDRPWYELYNSDKPVIVGHYNYTHTDQPFIYQDKVFGIDTDCVTGKALTGILLPSFRFVSVPSRGNMWMQVRRTYHVTKQKPSARRVSAVTAWSEEQDKELNFLFQKLQEANLRVMSQVYGISGYQELTPRQQSKLYSEIVGQGVVPNLLHLTRMGKLDIDLMRKIVHDPERLSLLTAKAIEFSNGVIIK